VITGHERAEREGSAIDYAVLAALPGTLVFLMGVKNLEQIARQLVSQGKSPSTPVAVIERGCTARQRQVIGTLETIAQVVTDAKIGSPAVTVVGTVVGLSSILSQTGLHLPLRGQRVLVTRTRKQAGRLSEKLRAQGADALEIPLIRIEPNLDASLWDSLFSKLSQANWLVFTSENGVDIFLEQMRNRRQDVRSLNALRIAAVGPATADRLLVAGLVADVVPTVFTVEALSQTMLPLVTPGMRVVLARADIANPEIHSTLVSVGCLVDDFPIYRTLPEPAFHAILADLLRQGEIDWITFASSSTVDAFMLALGDHRDLLGATQFACIGPVTAQTARKHGLPIAAEAKVYTLDGLVQAIGDNLSASSEVLS
jgi:uroporphyrinogen III methyltransferase/synthase